MTFDGEAVSLKPSIGSWNLECRSHYVVDRGRVIAAGTWTDGEIVAERRRDSHVKAEYYRSRNQDNGQPGKPAVTEVGPARRRFWYRAKRWLGLE